MLKSGAAFESGTIIGRCVTLREYVAPKTTAHGAPCRSACSLSKCSDCQRREFADRTLHCTLPRATAVGSFQVDRSHVEPFGTAVTKGDMPSKLASAAAPWEPSHGDVSRPDPVRCGERTSTCSSASVRFGARNRRYCACQFARISPGVDTSRSVHTTVCHDWSTLEHCNPMTRSARQTLKRDSELSPREPNEAAGHSGVPLGRSAST